MILPEVLRSPYLKAEEPNRDSTLDLDSELPSAEVVTVRLHPATMHSLKCIADIVHVPVEEMAYRAIEKVVDEIRWRIPGNG